LPEYPVYPHSAVSSNPIHLDELIDAYFAAVDAELTAESQRAALEGEFAPEASE
jgi:hypothetical protein